MSDINLELFRLRNKNISPDTLNIYCFWLSKISKFDKDTISSFFDEYMKKDLSPGTLWYIYYAVLKYAQSLDFPPDMFAYLDNLKKRLPPQERKRYKRLREEDIKSLLSLCNAERDKLILLLSYTFARRVGEVLQLKRQDVTPNSITFPILKKRKSGKVMIKRKTFDGLEPWLYDRIQSYISRSGGTEYIFVSKSGKRLQTNTISSLVYRISKPLKALGKEVRTHALRHARATYLYHEKRYSKLEVQTILDHEHSSTTDPYLDDLTDEEKKDLSKRLPSTKEVGEG